MTTTCRILIVPLLAAAAACGGGAKTKPPEPVVVKPRPKPTPPPPPPVCVKADLEMAQIGMATADDTSASFCVSDGGDYNQCFAADLESGKYSKLDAPLSTAAHASLEAPVARIDSTATEVSVCKGETECVVLKPKVAKGASQPIEAHVNAAGTHAVIMLGDRESGKGTAEIWDVAKKKKLIAIKYAKGDYKCGTGQMLGDAVYISGSVCAGPGAVGWLYSAKGKKLADVGGKEFFTYGMTPVQVGPTTWAFPDSDGNRIAIHDVKTGKLDKILELKLDADAATEGAEPAAAAPAPAKAGDKKKKPAVEPEPAAEEAAAEPAEDAAAEPAADAEPSSGGQPGEATLLRGGEGKLVLISGGPHPGSISVVDVASGEIKTVTSEICASERGD